MKPSVCPTDDALRRIVEGGDSDDMLRLDEDHVMDCGDCLTRLKAIMAQTSVSWPNPAQGEPSPAADLVQRLLTMRTDNATWAPDSTPGDPINPVEFVPPRQLGPFQIGELLGAGGVGLVYAAQDAELRRVVAIKILRPEHARNPTSRRRFLDEARAVAALSNDHIVPVYRVGDEGDVPYIAMPRLAGRSLADELKDRTKLPLVEAIEISKQVAVGLSAAHERGLIHRDIKPGNIWLEPNGRVKIVDFGLARFMDSDTRLTQTGLIVGTPAYMAPEQADDGTTVDHRADLFSLGCVIYQMLAGRVPFPGNTALAVFKTMAAGDAPRLSQVEPGVPERVSVLVDQMLKRDRDLRLNSALDVLKQLNSAQEPLARPWWNRRRMLASLGAGLAGALGLGAWFSARPRTLTANPSVVQFDAASVGEAISSFFVEPVMPLTMEMYVNLIGPAGQAGHIAGWGQHFSFHVELNNQWSLGLQTREAFRQVLGGPVALNRRVHLAAVREGNNHLLFVDGKKAGHLTLPASLFDPPAGPLSFGGGLAMQLQEIRVSKSARYSDDFTPVIRFEPDDDTLALYHCDDGAGQLLTDASRHRRHVTLHGASWVTVTGEITPAGSADEAPKPPEPRPPLAELAEDDGFAIRVEPNDRVTFKDVEFNDVGPVTVELVASLDVDHIVQPVHVIGPYGRLAVFVASNGWACTFSTDKGFKSLKCFEPVVTGRRYHLAAVFDGGAARWFIDGRLAVQHNFGPEARLHKVARRFNFGGGMTGTVDEIRVSDVARYDGDFKVNVRHEPDEHTLLLCHCDEGSGEWLNDSSKHRRKVNVGGLQWKRVKS